jgi:hypothetical protein
MNKWWILGVMVAIAFLLWVMLRRSGSPKTEEVQPPNYSSMDEEMVALASEAVKLAKGTFYMELDYSPESVKEVEELLGMMHEEFLRRQRDKQDAAGLEEDLRAKAVVWGAYIGEVIKRERPGRWERDTQMGKDTFGLQLESEQTVFPVSWVYKRIHDGESDNVWLKFAVATDRVKKLEFPTDAPPN